MCINLDLRYAPVDQRCPPKVLSAPSSQSLAQQSLMQARGIGRLFPETAAKVARQHADTPPETLAK